VRFVLDATLAPSRIATHDACTPVTPTERHEEFAITMQNRLSGRVDRLLWRSGAAALLAILGIAVCLVSANTARSESADCQRLRQEISEPPRNSQSAQYQAAAEKQRAEIDRTVAYAHSIGCEKRQFLFFGSPPPAECGALDARMARMRANLDDLQARAGGGQGGRGELIARYNAQCANAPSRSPNLLEALFGQQPKPTEVRDEPLLPDGLDKPERTIDPNIGEVRAGSKAVCVRACDGAFFPVSYSASGGRLDGLEDLCRALCPNADVSLYTYPSSGEIEQAVSISGARYIDSPNALQYRKTFDSSCSCRRRGQSWAEALANAEIKLGREDKTDIIVTPEKAAELSRPKPDPKLEAKSDPKAKSTKPIAAPTPVPAPAAPSGTDAYGVDLNLSQQAATISRETSGIADGEAKSGARVGQDQGQTIEVTGPDGVKRRVRIIGPTL
jgi:hypothetical protein